MDSALQNSVVLVTGSSGDIGRACARAFAAEGARLVLHANVRLDQAAALERELDTDCIAVQADLRNETQVEELFAAATNAFGRIDAVVANAGVWPPHDTPIHEMDLIQWENTLAVNLTGVFLTARAYFRHLLDAKPEHASLVIVGSSAAVFGEAGHADYAASKAGAVYGLTRTLKNEIVRLCPNGRVNTVNPGWTVTEMTRETLDDALVERITTTRPLKQLATPEDTANAVVFLSSPALAGHVTGEIWTVSGGMEGRLLE